MNADLFELCVENDHCEEKDRNFQLTRLTKTKWTVVEFMKPGKELLVYYGLLSNRFGFAIDQIRSLGYAPRENAYKLPNTFGGSVRGFT